MQHGKLLLNTVLNKEFRNFGPRSPDGLGGFNGRASTLFQKPLEKKIALQDVLPLLPESNLFCNSFMINNM
jgi:hypothetical protein